jgi:hypothetical protein
MNRKKVEKVEEEKKRKEKGVSREMLTQSISDYSYGY